MDEPSSVPRLRYLGARDVDDPVVDYDGLEVRGADGGRMGGIKGFIVDAATGRIQYFVVDSRGWLRSRRVLVPVGHATLSEDRRVMTVDIAGGRLAQLADFDPRVFGEFSDEDRRLVQQVLEDRPGDVKDTFGAAEPVAVATDAGLAQPRRTVVRVPAADDDDEMPCSER